MNQFTQDRNRLFSLVKQLLPLLTQQTNREDLKTLYALFTRNNILDFYADKFEGKGDYSTLVFDLEVALVAGRELYLDGDSITALLLYRLYQSGVLTREKISSKEEVVRLLKLMDKASALYNRKEAISSENFHNLLLSMAEDLRVVLIIIADRLFRLRYAKLLYNPEDCMTLAVEVSFLYAPIAHRLGLYKIKAEMEDLCLKWRDRKTFDFIVRKLGESKQARNTYIDAFIAPIKAKLNLELNVPFEIKGRTKSISSINNKLRKQPFEDIYDLFAIRIIVDCPKERERLICWQIYSIISDMYRPNPERLKDWISIPKSNGYESLHTTVMGPENRWVEVQIRSQRMDTIAEQGVAAHWRYKGIKSEGGLDEFLSTVRDTLEVVKLQEGLDRREVLERSMMTLKAQEIYVFTPKGEVLKLPKGATVLDFAFAIHSHVGAGASSGKVNGKNVSLRYQLNNGDNVEILTSSHQTPKPDWVNIVVSPRAKARIRQLLRAEEEKGVEVAKELIQRRLRNRKLIYNESLFTRLVVKKGYKNLSAFYADISKELLDVGAFIEQYAHELHHQDDGESLPQSTQYQRSASDFSVLLDNPLDKDVSSKETLIIDQGLSDLVYSFAQCCQPVWGDEVFGFVSSRGIRIHRIDCPNAPDMIERTGHRILSAKWSGVDSQQSSLVEIDVIGRDDIAVVTHIISLIKKESGTRLRNYSIDSEDGLFKGIFTIALEAGGNISRLIKKIRTAVGVKHVARI